MIRPAMSPTDTLVKQMELSIRVTATQDLKGATEEAAKIARTSYRYSLEETAVMLGNLEIIEKQVAVLRKQINAR